MERVPEFQDANIDAESAVGVLVRPPRLRDLVPDGRRSSRSFVLRRSNVARILLVISASVAAVFSLIGITSGFSLVPLVACLATIVLLFVGGAGDWFKRVPDFGGGYPDGYPGDPAGYQAGAYGTPHGAQPGTPYDQQHGVQPGQDAPPPQYPSADNPYGQPPSQEQPPGADNPYGQPPSEGGTDYPPKDYPNR